MTGIRAVKSATIRFSVSAPFYRIHFSVATVSGPRVRAIFVLWTLVDRLYCPRVGPTHPPDFAFGKLSAANPLGMAEMM
jgi:hypothetical protein